MQSDIESSREINVEDFVRLVEGLKQLHAADTDDTDTVEAFVALGGKVRQPFCYLLQILWHIASCASFTLQADRSGKVLIEKLRNTIKVTLEFGRE